MQWTFELKLLTALFVLTSVGVAFTFSRAWGLCVLYAVAPLCVFAASTRPRRLWLTLGVTGILLPVGWMVYWTELWKRGVERQLHFLEFAVASAVFWLVEVKLWALVHNLVGGNESSSDKSTKDLGIDQRRGR